MAQFLIGFWCGCAAAVLVVCLIYASKKRQVEDAKDRKTEYGEEDDFAEGTPDAATNLRVLLVDDSKLSRTVMRELLAKKQWKIFEAGAVRNV